MKTSRRRFMVGAGAAGAFLALPAVRHVRWGGQLYGREGYDPSLPFAPEGKVAWMNWSGIQKATPIDAIWPETEHELAAFVRDAKARVRPVGSGHSFAGLVPSDGYLVHTNSLSGLYALDAETGLATFGSGTNLYEAAELLDERGRAFENLSDIDVQTLAGAFSTGTHGTGQTLTALHDYITAFRLVTANGDILDVSAQSHPDLFAAGKVSLGALGIITQYTVKTVPAYKLHRQVIVMKWQDLHGQIRELASAHRNFEFYYVPGTGLGLVLLHDETDAPPSHIGEPDDEGTLEALKQLRDKLGWAPWLRRIVAQSQFPSGVIEERVDASRSLLATERPTIFNEMEYHLPLEEGPRLIGEVVERMEARKDVYFPIEYRHVASDPAWISPFSGGPRASIAIHAAGDERYDYFFKDFEPLYNRNGGRPHWGKLHSLGKDQFISLYPAFRRFMELRKELDPEGKFLNPHLAKLFGEKVGG